MIALQKQETTSQPQRWVTVRGKRIPITPSGGGLPLAAEQARQPPAQPQRPPPTPVPRPPRRYTYTQEHVEAARQKKFARVAAFAVRMPRLRREIEAALDLPDTPQEKVVAAVVALMDRCKFRIGTERYAEGHQTYGVTTLRPEHVKVEGDEVRFDFTGKKGVPWERAVTDPKLARLVADLQSQALPEAPLFWYNAGGGKQLRLTGAQVNAYLHRWGITAKDIRTFHATRIAWKSLRDAAPPKNAKEAKQNVTAAVKRVAEELGHTPAVAKSSYILPELLEGYVQTAGRELREPFAKRAFDPNVQRWITTVGGRRKGDYGIRFKKRTTRRVTDGRFREDAHEEGFRQWLLRLLRLKAGGTVNGGQARRE